MSPETVRIAYIDADGNKAVVTRQTGGQIDQMVDAFRAILVAGGWNASLAARLVIAEADEP